MAFLLNKTSLFRFHKSEDSLRLSRRGFHVELVAREKALLAEDPALRRFKSHKKGVQSIKRIGDVLTLAVLAGCWYEIYVKAVTREEVRQQAGKSA
ncbi:dehydrogenase [Lithospermum erythrorhizon]|uniref:Dehydrogenase n=1 Tax=Lithospermum erythrorhizon TaxID=34254 RepID=A0AAV3PH28_LITER